MKSLHKKAVGIGQVFIFITAAITFALIMIFGYKAVADLMETGEDVEFNAFKNNLELSIKDINSNYKSVSLPDFMVPGKYDRICFVDLETETTFENCMTDLENNPGAYACDVLEQAGGKYQNADENVFLEPRAPYAIKVHQIKLDSSQPFLCVPITNGRFKLRLEGLGDSTKISLIPTEIS